MITIRIRWAGHVASVGENTNGYRLFVEKPDEMSLLGKPRSR
jgi:hypothetical protein